MSSIGSNEDNTLNNKLDEISKALERIEGALVDLTENKEEK